MTVETGQTLVDAVLGWVRENGQGSGEDNGRVNKTTDLLGGGVLDSIGFIDLISFIETKTGAKIDLADIDPEAFTTVEGLCRHACGA